MESDKKKINFWKTWNEGLRINGAKKHIVAEMLLKGYYTTEILKKLGVNNNAIYWRSVQDWGFFEGKKMNREKIETFLHYYKQNLNNEKRDKMKLFSLPYGDYNGTK